MPAVDVRDLREQEQQLLMYIFLPTLNSVNTWYKRPLRTIGFYKQADKYESKKKKTNHLKENPIDRQAWQRCLQGLCVSVRVGTEGRVRGTARARESREELG
jgi:hypothetical protein